MTRWIQNFKIYDAVVGFLSIFMMNDFFIAERTPNVLLHYKSVLKHLPISVPYNDIAVTVCSSLVSARLASAFPGTKVIAVFGDASGPFFKRAAANGAGNCAATAHCETGAFRRAKITVDSNRGWNALNLRSAIVTRNHEACFSGLTKAFTGAIICPFPDFAGLSAKYPMTV